MAFFQGTNLEIGGTSYPGFLLVPHGIRAKMNYKAIRACEGLADVFPALPDSNLASRTYDLTLKDYLQTHVPTSSRISDTVKQIIWDICITALHACSKNLNLDLHLDKIYVCIDAGYIDFPCIKIIALEGETQENWMDSLRNVIENISNTCNTANDPFYIDFMGTFKVADNFRSIASCLNSEFFWSKNEKLTVLSKLGDFVDTNPSVFISKLQSNRNTLLSWRNLLSSDPTIGHFVNQHARVNNCAPSHPWYDRDEIDCLLVFVRVTLGHFRSIFPVAVFADEHQIIEFYDTTFPALMIGIYKGANEIENDEYFDFRREEYIKV